MEMIENRDMGILEFVATFNSEKDCENYLQSVTGIGNYCPHCGTESPYILNEEIRCRFKCRKCRKRFSIKSSTYMKNTKCGYKPWFMLWYNVSQNVKNVSSRQMAKNLGLTQKSIWWMTLKIRDSLVPKSFDKFKGTVEIDEAFVSKWKKFSNGVSNRKEPIIGIYERDSGMVRVELIPNRSKEVLENFIYNNIELGSRIISDGWSGYSDLHKSYDHRWVNHQLREYVSWDDPEVHTNNIESVWARLKGNIRGAHHQVSNEHLQSYIDEFVFKYNYRNLTQMDRFNMLISRSVLAVGQQSIE